MGDETAVDRWEMRRPTMRGTRRGGGVVASALDGQEAGQLLYADGEWRTLRREVREERMCVGRWRMRWRRKRLGSRRVVPDFVGYFWL
jgi:hypothetical protein